MFIIYTYFIYLFMNDYLYFFYNLNILDSIKKDLTNSGSAAYPLLLPLHVISLHTQHTHMHTHMHTHSTNTQTHTHTFAMVAAKPVE